MISAYILFNDFRNYSGNNNYTIIDLQLHKCFLNVCDRKTSTFSIVIHFLYFTYKMDTDKLAYGQNDSGIISADR